jgi:ABC-2 type transport system ATP-binding protein
MRQELLVQTTDLTKTYGGVRAVDGVSLSVRAGEIYGFLGPNGAGKTTTLRIVAGLVRPTAGTVAVLGRKPGHPETLARVGSLIESPGFYPYLSGRDNLRVLARYAGVHPNRAGAALELVDLAERGDDKYAGYSLGMKQRLGVAAALLNDPELLILDEPTNGLDPAGIRDMRALVKELAAVGHTVLLSSHQLGEVEQICDRVGVVSHGKLIAESTVEELRGEPGLLVGAEPLDVARASAERLVGPENVTVAGGKLQLRTDPAKAATVSRELHEAGVALTELRPLERHLEDVFLEMTDGEGP